MPAHYLHTLTISGKSTSCNSMMNNDVAAYNHDISNKSLQTRRKNAKSQTTSAETSCKNVENKYRLQENISYNNKKLRKQKPVEEIFPTFMPEKITHTSKNKNSIWKQD